MKEIKCPECGAIIKIDEKDYLDIVSQIRTEEFTSDLKEREEALKREYEQDKKILLANVEADKEKLKAQYILEQNKELDALKDEIRVLKTEKDNLSRETSIKVAEATSDLKDKLHEAETKLQVEKQEMMKEIQTQKEKFDSMIKDKDEMIAHYKDLKIQLSTKAIGEELEVHCKKLFDQYLRPVLSTSGNTIYFEKDNDVVDGTKADFVYRETTKEGAEVLSITFEMKNENEETETKHKNSDFFKKLDSDRKKKNTEYAVLVSLLEADNEEYNNGIVSVYEYENMYVIRPNSFVALINLLRNNAIKNMNIKNELELSKHQNIDITNFENELNDFQVAFSKNFESAETHYKAAIDRIDATIKSLEKIKDELTTSGNQLRLANNKAQDISVKKLTRGNETMKKKFEELNK